MQGFTQSTASKIVKHFRQILLWPLQLMPLRAGVQIHKHWELLEQPGPDNSWHPVVDEFRFFRISRGSVYMLESSHGGNRHM
jgi:hypothetical protein